MSLADSIRLQELLDGTCMEVSFFLECAVALTKLVQSAHQKDKVIGCLQPGVLLVHREMKEAYLAEEGGENYAYLSPEQLSRSNPLLPDKRSDLYTLGILFYEMLTGRLPLQARRLEEWIHVHMAVVPAPLSGLRPELEGPLEEITAKLLSKSPEQRYQSAYGLLADLRQCISLLNTTGEIERFETGLKDRISQFRLPRRLFGREEQARELRAVVERASAGESGFVLVTGRAGSGKTSLIGELQLSFTREGGRFITGKCDYMNNEIPFAPILQALRRLLRQTWSEAPDKVEQLKARLLEALGQGAGIITEILPEAVRLLGTIPLAEPLPPAEAALRFRRLLPAFIGMFAGEGQPLVLFLDDLQWADPDTLDFLRVFAEVEVTSGIAVIGSFRSETLEERMGSGDQNGASTAWLEQMLAMQRKPSSPLVQHIALEPLSYVDVRQFLSDIFEENSARVRLLAELLYHRTGGDPLYMHRLLDNLHREQCLYFDEARGSWEWDITAITALPEAPGLLQLIEQRIRLLPGDTVGLLGIAAALGYSFRVSDIASMSGYSLEDTLVLLQPAELESLISREESSPDIEAGGLVYSFLHDRIQQAAYGIVPEEEQAGLHLAIGRSMSRSTDKQAYSVFDRVYHLNLGSPKMDDRAERRALAELNLQAGLKSKATTAFAAALYFLETGLHLLGDEEAVPGSLPYRLMLELPECEYICGYTERAAALLDRLMGLTGDLLERSNIYRIRIAMYAYLKKDELAVKVGRKALAEFGWKLPLRPSHAAILKEVTLTQAALYRKRDQLTALPVNRDPHYKALSDLIMAIASSVFTVSLELSAVLFSRFVRYGLKAGNNEAFAYILAGYGLVILRNKMSLYQKGKLYIETASQLSAPFESTDLSCRLDYIRGLARLQQNPQEAGDYFRQSVQHGMEAANLSFVSIAMLTSTVNHTGSLHSLSRMIMEYEILSRKLVDEVTLSIFRIAKEYVARMQGDTGFSMEAALPVQNNSRSEESLNNEIYYICTCETELAYLEGRYRDALVWVAQGRFNTFRQTRMQVHKQHIYHALTLAALYPDALPEERSSFRRQLTKQLDSLKRWTGYFGRDSSACLLIKAEIERIDGKRTAAAKNYELAIATARREGNGMMEGIACERSSHFYRAAGSVAGADGFLADACRAYSLWGAEGKVQRLKERYPDLSLPSLLKAGEQAAAETATAIMDREAVPEQRKEAPNRFDGWPEPIERLDRISSFLESAVRYSGAVQGYVLNSDGKNFTVAAQSGNLEARVREDGTVFAESVVRYVVKTTEPVLLADAGRSSFAADPHIRKHPVLSVLCMPILFPGEAMTSVLYLENDLITGVFTLDGQNVLDFMIARMVYLHSVQRAGPQGNIYGQEPESAPAGPLEDPEDPLVDSLTYREKEILYSLSDGLSNKEIAERFGITEGTVKSHVFRLYGKLGVKRRAQAIARARELQLLD
ncbi:AAA family ATPase [Paenibacillus tianjinensis]|uniref:AAA family ATPase n=1 Tax=Paenibacillus tianjinensis TaxID=2810347 RepID=A0ABX7LE46_9BACL|nr:AAA family ATPase [Paenibacillus tianjinensis]QSF46312.1 AAA family ATPase [Paenibacillus tianjinensis]